MNTTVTKKSHPALHKAISEIVQDMGYLGNVKKKFNIPSHIDVDKLESQLSQLDQTSDSAMAGYKGYNAYHKKKHGCPDPIKSDFNTPDAYGHKYSQFDMFVMPVNDTCEYLSEIFHFEYSAKFLSDLFNGEDGLEHKLFVNERDQ